MTSGLMLFAFSPGLLPAPAPAASVALGVRPAPQVFIDTPRRGSQGAAWACVPLLALAVAGSTARRGATSHFGARESESEPSPRPGLSRRTALGVAAGLGVASALRPVEAKGEPSVKLYFGAGCFWHVQHEMVLEEQKRLKRTSQQITAVSGYAGGEQLGDGGKVCYHNPRRFADYGQMGHAEAVQVDVPVSAVPDFARKYFSLFGSMGIRHDPQDAGGEYRSVVGLPGGMSSPHFEAFREAASGAASGMSLKAGSGGDGDTLREKTVLVYDSRAYPFHAAELYHQFHDDFMGAPYGKAYNMLNPTLYKDGVLTNTGCPEPDPRMPKNPYV